MTFKADVAMRDDVYAAIAHVEKELCGLDCTRPTHGVGSTGDSEDGFDAIGPGLSYTTVNGTTPFAFNLRHYHQYNAEHR